MFKMREPDAYGAGYFGASRGNRIHNGVDFACGAGSCIKSTVDGKVTKLGYPYKGDSNLKYVEVTDSRRRYRHRFFYVEPSVEKGGRILEGDLLGKSQTLQDKYPDGMTDHIHYEIIARNGAFIDPGETFG